MSEHQSISSCLPMHYSGHQVRIVIDDDGVFWWVAQDVGDALGLERARDTVRNFPKDETRAYSIRTNAGPREMLTINEPGLYRLIFASRKPEAEVFKRWVFHDILPTIRKTGGYQVPSTPKGAHWVGTLTPSGQLPAPRPRVREHAEISWHLLQVWTLLRDSQEWLSNREVAQRAGVAPRTARAHTKYLTNLGMLDVHEIFPRHLYGVSERAARHNAGVFHRLNALAAVMQTRLTY